MTFLYSWWSNSDVTIYANPKDIECLQQEHTLNLPNHRYEIDWLVALVFSQKFRILGVILRLSLTKKELLLFTGYKNRWKTFA
jgi:hypothetical protein